jgi:hypothetical protein
MDKQRVATLSNVQQPNVHNTAVKRASRGFAAMGVQIMVIRASLSLSALMAADSIGEGNPRYDGRRG